MKATYNKSKIMRNAWYLKKVQPKMTFSACLSRAWRNEKMNIVMARIEGRVMEQSEPRPYTQPTGAAYAAGCLDYYANARNGQYLGD